MEHPLSNAAKLALFEVTTCVNDTAADEDRLSALQNELKLLILFFLADESNTRDVIWTSALSRGWGNLWSFVPYLHFRDMRRSHLPDAIDNTLCQYLDRTRKYVLPLNLYTNPFLCELSLNGYLITLERGIFVNWNSLVQLHLRDMSFGVGIIRDVLKGRPKLHTVKLLSCTGVCNIISEGLNTLIVIEHMIALPKLEILATKLESLHIEGSVNFVGKIQIKDVSTLVKARLIVSNIIPITNNNLMEVMDDQVQLLTSVNHAEDITIRGWCVKVLTILAMKGLASPSLDCKGLMVLIDMILEDLPATEILLQDSFV
ncbi:hypothetical protein CFP56_032495 [Quercus suber]|uniref:F-box/LRR-repeat protein n=1 Tax=Quercus suber TaxID=58331 RepID=A0AAW0JH47_QUESU